MLVKQGGGMGGVAISSSSFISCKGMLLPSSASARDTATAQRWGRAGEEGYQARPRLVLGGAGIPHSLASRI